MVCACFFVNGMHSKKYVCQLIYSSFFSSARSHFGHFGLDLTTATTMDTCTGDRYTLEHFHNVVRERCTDTNTWSVTSVFTRLDSEKEFNPTGIYGQMFNDWNVLLAVGI